LLNYTLLFAGTGENVLESINSAAWNNGGVWSVDASFTPTTGNFGIPDRVSRGASGSGINWDFTDNQLSTALNATLVLDTNAPAFTTGTVSFSGEGGAAGGQPFLVPSPEPATLTLALVGLPLAGAFGYRRLRRGKPA
jgi:hypothetical protein